MNAGSVLLTLALLCSTALPASAQSNCMEIAVMEATALERLTTMSVAYVVESTFLPLVAKLRHAEDKEQVLFEIASLDDDVRTLFWLAYFQQVVPSAEPHRFFTAMAEHEKLRADVEALSVVEGQTSTTTGFDFMTALAKKMDPVAHFSSVEHALRDVGLNDRAAVFAEMRDLASTGFDADFSALDTDFGGHVQLQESIDAHVAGRPSLQEWDRRARNALPEDDRLHWLVAGLNAFDDAEIDALPMAIERIFVVQMFEAEVLNGGVHQFFFNSSGRYATEVVEALEAFGLPVHADAVRKGMAMFEQPYDTDTAMRQQRNSRSEWSDWDDALNELTNIVDDGKIRPAVIAFAEREGLLPR